MEKASLLLRTGKGKNKLTKQVKSCYYYNYNMYNWSTDEEELKKDKEKYSIWRIEQMVNFGLDGEKIKREDLEKYWSKINIDLDRRKFLSLLLHGK